LHKEQIAQRIKNKQFAHAGVYNRWMLNFVSIQECL